MSWRSRLGRLAIAGLLAVVLSDAGRHREFLTLEAGGAPVPQEARSGAAPPSVDPRTGPAAAVPPAQAEAAALKREAVAVAAQVSEAYPQDALVYALLGSAYYNTGQAEQATRQLERCIELNPDLAEAYEVLARVAYDKGELPNTVKLCQDALQRGSPSPQVLNLLGRALMDQGQTAEALEVFGRAVRLPRPASESYYLLGQANLQSGNHQQAKENFLEATRRVPDHTQAFFGLYTACLRLGQTEEANRYREQFQKLETIDRRTLTDRSAQEDTLTGLPLVRKTVARTLFGAAQIYRLHEQPAKAAALYRNSARLDPDNRMYRAALEAHYVQGKLPADGVALFKQLVIEQPDNPLNYYYLGRLESRLDRFDAAEQAYRKTQELAPGWPDGYRAMVELYVRAQRKPADAASLAHKLVALDPSGPHYYLLAVACVRNNDRPAAVEAIKQAVTLSPNEPRYKDLLQQLEARQP